MAKLDKNELRVGLFILVPVVFLLFFIILKLGYSFATASIDVNLKIDSLTSVKKGTPVMIKGYPIGRVVDIRPVYKPALHFLALMRIKKEVELNEDCSAIIQNQNILGDPVIEIRNPEKNGNALRHGDVIEGIEYVSLESVLQDVHVLLTTLSKTAQSINRISQDSRQNLRVLITSLSESGEHMSKIFESAQTDIIEILRSFRKTASTMNEISVELKKHPLKFLFKDKD